MKTLEKKQVKEKGILFSTDMIKAILAGNKTQTRRLVKATGKQEEWLSHELLNSSPKAVFFCDDKLSGVQLDHPKSGPLGFVKSKYKVDDILYVKESWHYVGSYNALYKADLDPNEYNDYKWKPSLFMPKDYARIFLKVINVRVERLQDISEDDYLKEGVESIVSYQKLWDSLSGKKEGCSWESNPFVWVYDFEVIKR